ncbi:MAG: hypothetical protein IPJ65_15915 [Archangiaceae bacterium]|nr:hypothetical protein [Archangiaceae bacterium]
MGVGGVRGGGRKGGAGGAGAAKGGGAVGGAKGAGFAGKVDQAQGLVGPSGLVASSGVAGLDPVTATALDIARQLKSGLIKTKEEATKKLVANILKEKVRMQSKALTKKIAETLQDDPRLSQALERLWGRGAEE